VQPDPLPAPDGKPRLEGTIPMPSAGDLAFFAEDAGCPYVALTAPGAQDKNILQVYDLRQMKAVGAPIAGKFDGGFQQVRVSPEGEYLTTPAASARTPSLDIFSVATGRLVRRLEVDQDPQLKVAFFDFAGKDRLLTVKQGGSLEQQNVFEVWDLKTGEPVADFVWEGFFTDKFCTLSPGRKYLVLAASNIITGHYMLAWDLTAGKPAGMFEFQDKKAEGGQIAALCLSPDGTKLALFWIASNGAGSVPHIRCWDAQTGKPLVDHPLPKLNRGPAALWTASGLRNLQWLPDGSGWLVFSHFVIDYESGAVVGRLGREPTEAGQILPRYFADRDHATTALEDNLGLPKALTVMQLPREQIDAEVKKARGDKPPPR
jgi:WD40 repeat protein